MFVVYDKEKNCVPIRVWLASVDDIEPGCLQQATNLSNLPFVYSHVVLCPDTHQGYGMPIGGVIACDRVVIPNAVGNDIGCGVLAVQTSLTDISTENLKAILGEIRSRIPVGFAHHTEPIISSGALPEFGPEYSKSGEDERRGLLSWEDGYPVICKEYNSALHQVGTLGSGNHFVEIQKGSDGYIWYMIHSGSRNLGKKVADYHNKIAKALNRDWHSKVDNSWDLAFLPVNSEEGQTYLREMNYCLEFARLNRNKMADQIAIAFESIVGSVSFTDRIDIHHNYADIENHKGRNLWVHRKGATRAYEGELGVIPGSQGTKSYIVKGKGNPESFKSCSHGAGRRMGRKQAVRELDLNEEVKKLEDKGILHAIRGKNDLEEAAGAYKDIEEVIANEADLVDVVVELQPLAVVKG